MPRGAHFFQTTERTPPQSCAHFSLRTSDLNYSETSIRNRDKKWVQHLANQAQDLLDAALAALERGESCQEMTVLIGRDGGIQMCADSDWPLDSLMLDRGARTGYRVSPRRGSVRVEGREGLRRCVLEGSTALRAAAGILR
jgi:hypothetical protein